ncbi:hypothetical protein IV417_11715 [Alphaproteobacteria bacterium KMM 3653]|uniref:Fungal lipase-like domain-containing protein n=1 Tax=Harenicola maris TaxID=2841044 RepID=A0AAP2CQX6_9RHOB|nr:hypothetical protein [Harenicola maris]
MLTLKAAEIMQEGYKKNPNLPITHALNKRGVQAFLLRDKTVVVAGTNQLSDWLRYNLRVATRPPRIRDLTTRKGASGAIWHGGFLSHAEVLYDWAAPLKPRRFIGHSLGAAAVQIVGASLNTPTIAFASPRTRKGKARFKGEGWVLNICRIDDTVCHVPPEVLGFRQVGSRYYLRPIKPNKGLDHNMGHYIRLLKNRDAAGNTPLQWPR